MADRTRTKRGRNRVDKTAGLSPASQVLQRQRVVRCDLVRESVDGGVWNTSSMGFHSDKNAKHRNRDRKHRNMARCSRSHFGAANR